MTPFATPAAGGIATHRSATPAFGAAEAAAPAGARFSDMLQAQRAATAPAPQPRPAPQATPPAAQPAAQPARPQAAADASRDERARADRAERAPARREQPPGKNAIHPPRKDSTQPASKDATPSAESAATPDATPAATPPSGRPAAAGGRRADSQEADTAEDPGSAVPEQPGVELAAVAAADAADKQGEPVVDTPAPPAWFAVLGLAPPPAQPVPALGGAAPHDVPPGDALTPAATAGRAKADGVVAQLQAEPELPADAASPGDADARDFAAMLAATPAATGTPAAAAAAAPAALELAATSPAHAPLHAAASAAPAVAAPAAAVVTLATPLGAPDFSQALAAQLTTLAREGVHEAQLQLNPAEMGPINVQIVVEGQQAQIDFSAAHAATRQVLEDGLPGLAAALHASGLTLSGGGVFEHGQRGSRDASAAAPGGTRRGERSGVDGVAADAARSTPLPAARGLLDLYA